MPLEPLLGKTTNLILQHARRNKYGEWLYVERGSDYWLSLAKKYNSYSYYLLAITLSAAEAWELIDAKDNNS